MRNNLVLYAFMLVLSSINAQLMVDTSLSPQELVEDVLTKSRCATTAAYSSYTGTAFGFNGLAHFTYTGEGFPFKEGIILSTGAATKVVGPNDSDLGDGLLTSSWKGDADLQNITSTPNTVNATYLEFKFVPSIQKMSFDFIFASEEYNELFQCDFSDVFAFILTDSSGNSKNLAVVPGTNTPIKVTTVHGSLKGSKCGAINEKYFDAYNDPIVSVTNFNGQTVPITAEADVVPGETYTIKLVIGDQIDGNYDSAVFLKAGSFKISGDLGPDRTVANGNPVCENSVLPLNPGVSDSATFTWYKNGVAVAGETANILEVHEPGTYGVEYTLASGCSGKDEIVIEYAPNPSIQIKSELLLCESNGDGQEAFNLKLALTNIPDKYKKNILFYEDQEAIDNNTPITQVESYTNIRNPQTVKAAVVTEYGCVVYYDVALRIDDFPAIETSITDRYSCMVDGAAIFDLSLLNPSIYANDGLQFSYFRTREAAANNEESQKIKTPKTYTVSEVGKSTVFVRVATYNELCFQIVPVNLLVEEAPVSKLNDVYVICADTNNSENSIEVHTGLDANAFSFIWYRGKGDQKQQLVAQQNASLLIEEANLGWYTVYMQNANSCGIWKAFEVKRSVPPTSFMAQLVSKPYEANQTIEAKVVGDGNYKFQINGGTWQDSPRFTRLPYGVHTITVKDSFGCYSKSVEVKIIDYPRFFSPNGDGINDKWNIFEALELPKNAEVLIFDKYGKLLKKLSQQNNEWDGTLNGRQLPSDNYWFKIIFKNVSGNNNINGHFVLKR